jgi:hypothetical protein
MFRRLKIEGKGPGSVVHLEMPRKVEATDLVPCIECKPGDVVLGKRPGSDEYEKFILIRLLEQPGWAMVMPVNLPGLVLREQPC